jgi:transmembrane sensor
MSDQFEKIAQLLFKHIAGELSAEERRDLDAWIAEKEQNRVLFEKITNKDTLQKELADFTGTNKEASWEALSHKIFPQGTIWWRYAAAAVIIVLLSAGAFIFFNQSLNQTETAKQGNASQTFAKNETPGGEKAILTLSNGSKIILDTVQNGSLAEQGGTKLVKQGEQLFYQTAIAKNSAGEVFFNTVSIPRGGQYLSVRLSDGSLVWLNASSTIRFPVQFTGNERTVELSGEAYFEVAPNAAMPFKVKKGDNEVRVLGTHFNVNAYDDEKDIKVTLLEGSVQVSQHVAHTSKRLIPGQQAVINNAGHINVQEVNAEESISWRDGKYIFNEMPIEDIMRQAARWYNVKVVYESPISHLYTCVIDRKKPLAKSLELMMLTQDIDFEISKDVIIVRPK